MIRTLIFVAGLLLIMTSCSMSGDTAAAEQAVSKFHELLDAGRFVELYEGSASELKRATPQKDFVALREAAHRKLGNTKSSEKRNWNVNYHTSGTFVTLTYKTVYAEGEASEQFVFRMQDKAATLLRYNINSNALILK